MWGSDDTTDAVRGRGSGMLGSAGEHTSVNNYKRIVWTGPSFSRSPLTLRFTLSLLLSHLSLPLSRYRVQSQAEEEEGLDRLAGEQSAPLREG